MTLKKIIILIFLLVLVVIVINFANRLLFVEEPVNEIGLSSSALAMGGNPNIDDLKTKLKVVSDEYLAKNIDSFVEIKDEAYQLSLEYKLTPKIKQLGFCSSFYYYCWNIFLPYLLETKSGKKYIIIVQLSDGKNYNHDINNFYVIRSKIIEY